MGVHRENKSWGVRELWLTPAPWLSLPKPSPFRRSCSGFESVERSRGLINSTPFPCIWLPDVSGSAGRRVARAQNGHRDPEPYARRPHCGSAPTRPPPASVATRTAPTHPPRPLSPPAALSATGQLFWTVPLATRALLCSPAAAPRSLNSFLRCANGFRLRGAN